MERYKYNSFYSLPDLITFCPVELRLKRLRDGLTLTLSITEMRVIFLTWHIFSLDSTKLKTYAPGLIKTRELRLRGCCSLVKLCLLGLGTRRTLPTFACMGANFQATSFAVERRTLRKHS